MDVCTVIKARLQELGLEQKDLAAAAEVTERAKPGIGFAAKWKQRDNSSEKKCQRSRDLSKDQDGAGIQLICASPALISPLARSNRR